MENKEDFSHLLEGRDFRLRFYNFARNIVVKPIIQRYLDTEVLGAEKIPTDKSGIFVTHHAVYFDSLLLGTTFDKKIHGWIAEHVFDSRKKLYTCLELVPVKTKGGKDRDELKALLNAYIRTKELSLFWLKNTTDLVATTNDGLAETCLDEKGEIKSLEDRMNHAGVTNLAYEAKVPVFPISCWIPEEHRKELLIAKGWSSFKYLEKHKKIPCRFYINGPLNVEDYANKKLLQEDIRKKQIEGFKILESL